MQRCWHIVLAKEIKFKSLFLKLLCSKRESTLGYVESNGQPSPSVNESPKVISRFSVVFLGKLQVLSPKPNTLVGRQ